MVSQLLKSLPKFVYINNGPILVNNLERVLPLPVYGQLGNVWPGIVPCRVKILSLL